MTRQQQWFWQQLLSPVACSEASDDGDGVSCGCAIAWWHGIAAGSVRAEADGRRQCMALAWAIANGPKAGTSMTSRRHLAAQRYAPHICGKHSSNQLLIASAQLPAGRFDSQLAAGHWRLRYHFSVHELAGRLLQTIRKRESLRAGDRVAAAVSGGADSVALLCLLLELRDELGIVLSIAHVNHKLRGEESDEDERFVGRLAQEHGVEFHLRVAPIEGRASSGNSAAGSGIEAAARELRYSFFRELLHEGCVTKIATAHTLDDQAETILLRIFRGTGIRGLAGIHPRIIFDQRKRPFGEVVRLLLGFRRAALREFLSERNQGWREDSSNRNIAFLRNRVRHRLLPLIVQEFGEAAIEHMSEIAEIARAEEEHWISDHPEIAEHLSLEAKVSLPEPRPAASLPLRPLLARSLAAQRRLLRTWLEANAPEVRVSFRLIDETLELARTSLDNPLGKSLDLSGGWNLRLVRQGRSRQFLLQLEFSGGLSSEDESQRRTEYQYSLPVPGVVDVAELSNRIEARVVDAARVPEAERGQLLDIARVPKQVLIRNWRAGDRYWPAHTAAAKKVKELLGDRHATGNEKKLWPVAVAEGCGLVWMRGFAVPAAWQAPADATKAVWIRESRA
jgi:tRNA(Ile)-lysidine synthase